MLLLLFEDLCLSVFEGVTHYCIWHSFTLKKVKPICSSTLLLVMMVENSGKSGKSE